MTPATSCSGEIAWSSPDVLIPCVLSAGSVAPPGSHEDERRGSRRFAGRGRRGVGIAVAGEDGRALLIDQARQPPGGVVRVVGLDRQLAALVAVDRLHLARGIVGQVDRFVRHGVAAAEARRSE